MLRLGPTSGGGLGGVRDRVEPLQRRTRAAPGKALDFVDLVRRAGQAASNLHQHSVGKDAVGGDIAGPRYGFPALPQLAGHRELFARAQRRHALDIAPRPLRGRGDVGVLSHDVVELLERPVQLLFLREDIPQGHGKLVEQFHIERGVVAPLAGQRGLGPVGIAVALFQFDVEKLQHHRAQVRVGVAGEAGRELRIEEGARVKTQPGQARQIRRRGVDDPLLAIEHRGERGAKFRAVVLRSKQHGSGLSPTDLHEESAVVVAVGGGALGVDSKRARTGGEPLRRSVELARGGQDLRGAFERNLTQLGHGSRVSLAAELGHALRRETGDVGENLRKGLDMRGQIKALGGPGSAHFQLVGARRPANLAVAHRRRGGDGAAQVGVGSPAQVEGLSKPLPGNVRKQRVARYSVVQVCLNVGHQAHGALPGFLRARVMQEDETAEGVSLRISRDGVSVCVVAAGDLEADGVAKRG